MKKIPSLFKRDFTRPNAPIVDEYEIALPADAVPTRKFDGTAVRITNRAVYIRYDAKRGRQPPEGFEPCDDAPDPVTGHFPGWIPANLSSRENQRLVEAIQRYTADYKYPPDGTYELCGPKVNGNPEHLSGHQLIPHGKETLTLVPRTFDGLRAYLEPLDIEGVVWWIDGAPLTKIKKRDFGLSRHARDI